MSTAGLCLWGVIFRRNSIMKIINWYDDVTQLQIGPCKIYWPFPLASGLNGSAAKIFGISVYGVDSKLIKLLYKPIKKLYDFKWWLNYRLNPDHRYHIVNTGLKPAYYDIDTIMLHANMVLLCRFVESESRGAAQLEKNIKEFENDISPPINQIEFLRETLVIYYWWKNGYQKDWDEYNKQLSDTFSGKMEWKELENGNMELIDIDINKNAKLTPEQLHELEVSLYSKEENMLIRLVKIRRSLWT